MGAHLRSLIITCEKPGCSSRAVDALFNTYNALLGNYCRKHAQGELQRLMRIAAARDAAKINQATTTEENRHHGN